MTSEIEKDIDQCKEFAQKKVGLIETRYRDILSTRSFETLIGKLKREIDSIFLPLLVLTKNVTTLHSLSRHSDGGEVPPLACFTSYDRDHWMFCSHRRISRIADSFERSITRYLAQWPKNQGPTTTTAIVGDSESHNGGESLVFFRQNGRGVVYKPTSMGLPALVYSIISTFVNPHIESKIFIPEICDSRSNYGFIEELDLESANSEGFSPESYYYQLGAWMCVAYVLRIADLHYENLLVVDGRPVIVDLEASLYMDFYSQDSRWTVESTGLIASDRTSGIDGGGIVRRRQSWVDWSKPSSPIMRHTKESEFYSNRLVIDGHWQKPEKFINSILKGFTDTYTALTHRRERVVRHISESLRRRKLTSRILVRYTWDYLVMLQRLHQPDRYDEASNTVWSRCKHNDVHNRPMPLEIAASEFHDLWNGDIPYFSSDIKSSLVSHHSGPVYESSSRSGFESVVDTLNSLSAKDLCHQVEIIGGWAPTIEAGS